QGIRRPPRPRADRLRVLQPGGGRCGHRAHQPRGAVREPREQRPGRLRGTRPPRLDTGRHHQESRGQLQLPLARRAAARWRAALTGALVGGVLWAAVGKTFTAFVVYSTRLTLVYAGFAVVVAALLWTYFGWLILLAGAQLSFYVQNPAYLRLGLQPLRLSAAELEELSLRLMYFVGRAHAAGSRLWSVSRLAAELGLPGIAVAQMATSLERAGLLVVTERGELLPARDIRNIRVQEILDIARRQGSGHVAPHQLPIPAVDRLLAGLDEARRHRCGQ